MKCLQQGPASKLKWTHFLVQRYLKKIKMAIESAFCHWSSILILNHSLHTDFCYIFRFLSSTIESYNSIFIFLYPNLSGNILFPNFRTIESINDDLLHLEHAVYKRRCCHESPRVSLLTKTQVQETSVLFLIKKQAEPNVPPTIQKPLCRCCYHNHLSKHSCGICLEKV